MGTQQVDYLSDGRTNERTDKKLCGELQNMGLEE